MDGTDASQKGDRKLLESQLSPAMTYLEANDQEMERLLQTIIDQCKLHPAKMKAQTLKGLDYSGETLSKRPKKE